MGELRNPFTSHLDEEQQEMSCVEKTCFNPISFIFWGIVRTPYVLFIQVPGNLLLGGEYEEPNPAFLTHRRIGTSQPPPQLRM